MSAALLTIDMQQGMFMLPIAPFRGEEVVATVARLQSRARAAGVPLLHVQHDGGTGHILAKGTSGWPFHTALAPRAEEGVIEKRHCSAFQETELHERLARADIRRIIVAGMQTEHCVDAACRAARALGYAVVLAKDAHTAFDSPVLPAAQIVAHHNLTLGESFVELIAADAIEF